jgi:hypothetical protein
MASKRTTPFRVALGKAMDKLEYSVLAEPLMVSIVTLATDSAFTVAKARAPVVTGTLRDSIYKLVKTTGHSVTGYVGVPYSRVPYIWKVIVGGRRQKPNGFMEQARDSGFDAARRAFRKMTQERFDRINRL